VVRITLFNYETPDGIVYARRLHLINGNLSWVRRYPNGYPTPVNKNQVPAEIVRAYELEIGLAGRNLCV
jgi:hypothetical protein